MKRKPYPTDLTDAQWKVIQPFITTENKRGRPVQDPRELINGVLYIFKSGLDWRMMPHDLPAWQTVYGCYRRWEKDGTWERVNAYLSKQLQTPLDNQNKSLLMTWISTRLKQIKEDEVTGYQQPMS